jgi:hypothetical protein
MIRGNTKQTRLKLWKKRLSVRNEEISLAASTSACDVPRSGLYEMVLAPLILVDNGNKRLIAAKEFASAPASSCMTLPTAIR